VQFGAMLVHRAITFMQLIRKTSLKASAQVITQPDKTVDSFKTRLGKLFGRKSYPVVETKSMHQA